MFLGSSSYYYLPLILQAICAIHCFRRGTQQKWIWLIVFLPVVGSLVYLYSEVLTRRNVNNFKSGGVALFNSGVSVKKLEENLRFSDTFANRIALADAYLAKHETHKAIELYEKSLTGAFSENDHVLSQLITAYATEERYDDVIRTAEKLRLANDKKFNRSAAHLLYADALEYTGQTTAAEKEYQLMKGRYSHFEHRFKYGQFLQRAGRNDEAANIYTDILEEAAHLSAAERKSAQTWVNLAKAEMKAMKV